MLSIFLQELMLIIGNGLEKLDIILINWKRNLENLESLSENQGDYFEKLKMILKKLE